MPAAEPDRQPFTYALLRVVPSAERGERMNVGVVLYCRRTNFLDLRTRSTRRASLRSRPTSTPRRSARAWRRWPRRLRPARGRRARRAQPSERFGWLVAKSSTVIQPSEVHTGLTDDPRPRSSACSRPSSHRGPLEIAGVHRQAHPCSARHHALEAWKTAGHGRVATHAPDRRGGARLRGPHRVAQHAASGAMRDLFEHHPPPAAEPLSEGAVFGLSGALMISVRLAGDAVPPIDIEGRAMSSSSMPAAISASRRGGR